MKLIIEREATFENNSESEVKVTQKIIMSICKGSTMNMHNSQINLKSHAPRARLQLEVSVHEKDVSPILHLWIIISSRRGKRNKLITFTLGSIACSLFSVSEFQHSCHYFTARVLGEATFLGITGCLMSFTGGVINIVQYKKLTRERQRFYM